MELPFAYGWGDVTGCKYIQKRSLLFDCQLVDQQRTGMQCGNLEHGGGGRVVRSLMTATPSQTFMVMHTHRQYSRHRDASLQAAGHPALGKAHLHDEGHVGATQASCKLGQIDLKLGKHGKVVVVVASAEKAHGVGLPGVAVGVDAACGIPVP